MRVIDLQKSVVDLSGHENDMSLGQVLANTLVGQTEGDSIKLLDWAMALYKKGLISVDNTDFKWLYDFVKNNNNMVVLVKGQILKEMDNITAEV